MKREFDSEIEPACIISLMDIGDFVKRNRQSSCHNRKDLNTDEKKKKICYGVLPFCFRSKVVPIVHVTASMANQSMFVNFDN